METKRYSYTPATATMRSYVGYLETKSEIATALNNITLGTGASNRIGAKIKLKSIVIHYRVFVDATFVKDQETDANIDTTSTIASPYVL